MTINKSIIRNFGLKQGETTIDTRNIAFDVEKNWFKQNKSVDGYFESFRVFVTKTSDNLSLDRSSLLKLRLIGRENREGSRIDHVHFSSFDNPYQIVLNLDAIEDYSILEETESFLDFSVELEHYSFTKTIDYHVTIQLNKAKPSCVVKFRPNNGLRYVHKDVCVGYLDITNSNNCRYAEMASAVLSLKYPNEDLESIVSFGQLTELNESSPYYEHSGLMEKSDEPQSCLIRNRISNQKLELKRIPAQDTVSIPVYMDLNSLTNPTNGSREEKFELYEKNILTDEIKTTEHKIRIEQDTTTTRLYVKCNGFNIEDAAAVACGKCNWIHHQAGRLERDVRLADIKIGNEASNPGISPRSAVRIQGLKITPDFDRNEINYQMSFLEIEGAEKQDFVVLENKVDSFVSYSCRLLHRNIDDIPSNNTEIRFNIDFKYIEDVEGNCDEESAEWKPFHGVAKIIVEKDPGMEWLCVDYGTSASVAIYGDGTSQSQLLKLNNRNKMIIEERENQERMRTPRFEEGEYFLSSNIMLQSEEPVLLSEDTRHSLVYLSPSEPRFHHAMSYRLPYMKALVGYTDIPNGNLYADFSYKLNPTDEVTVTFRESPLSVEDVYKATYRVLFQDYISRCIPDGKEVNKIVLSVPNTYTPLHIKRLRDIVESEIPSLRSDYIWFVSESDAIAYYYLKHRREFNNEMANDENANKENVLIFDMGAGTLDVTALSIEQVKDENGKDSTKVTMDSKLGVNKAGNYLDFILAKTLVSIYPDIFTEENTLEHHVGGQWEELQGKLKYFIKNVLKPVLFSEDKLVFSGWNNQAGVDCNDFELDLRRIRESEIVQSFIAEVTDGVFDRFVAISGKKNNDFPIHTLIMTGRCVQFGNIKERLKVKVDKWNDDTHCHALEIVGDELKTIVAQGALYYAVLYGRRYSPIVLNNRNIYAKYGVLYIDGRQKWRYQPLLDKDSKWIRHISLQSGQNNGMQIYTYDTDRLSADPKSNTLDLSNTIKAYLVQCYSPDPAKDFEDEEHRNDYITIMASFAPGNASEDPRNVHVRLVVDENNEMTFTAGKQTFNSFASVKIDVETNNTYKHSMWPYA